MAAGTEFVAKYRLIRHTRQGARVLLTGDIFYTYLDQTTPDKFLYLQGGGPLSTGITWPVQGPEKALNPGEYLVLQGYIISPTATSWDNSGANSSAVRINVFERDLNTKLGITKTLTLYDRDTSATLIANAVVVVIGNVYQDLVCWKVPDGCMWQLFGELNVRSGSTS